MLFEHKPDSEFFACLCRVRGAHQNETKLKAHLAQISLLRCAVRTLHALAYPLGYNHFLFVGKYPPYAHL